MAFDRNGIRYRVYTDENSYFEAAMTNGTKNEIEHRKSGYPRRTCQNTKEDFFQKWTRRAPFQESSFLAACPENYSHPIHPVPRKERQPPVSSFRISKANNAILHGRYRSLWTCSINRWERVLQSLYGDKFSRAHRTNPQGNLLQHRTKTPTWWRRTYSGRYQSLIRYRMQDDE